MSKKIVHYSIGEVAKLKKISIRTLRYYHETGIFIPSQINEENGYRYYTSNQLLHLDTIIGLRELGVNIKELQDIFERSNTEEFMAFIKEKNKETKEKIRQLEETNQLLEKLHDRMEESRISIDKEGIEYKYFSERHLLTEAITKREESIPEILNEERLYEKMEDLNLLTKFEAGMLYQLNSEGNLKPAFVFEVIDTPPLSNFEYEIIPSGYFLTCHFSSEVAEEKMKSLVEDLRNKKINPQFILAFYLMVDVFNTDVYQIQAQIYVGETPL